MTSAVDELLDLGGSPRRADARRNVERLVAAARDALAEDGLDTTTREVARRAGVGLGTLYRQVPSLDALLEAILLDSIAAMTAHAVRALRNADPWQAFAEFAETFVQLRATSCGLHAALGGDRDDILNAEITQLRQAIHDLVRRTQQAGALRGDIDWRDIVFALASAIPADHTVGLPARPGQWKHNLRIILDGLRPPDARRP